MRGFHFPPLSRTICEGMARRTHARYSFQLVKIVSFTFSFYVMIVLFIFWKVILKKLFFKFFCIYLLLKILMNRKYFLVNRNNFQSKKNLVWFPEKYFFFWLCLFSGKWFLENHFPKFPVFVCHYKSWSTKNTFQLKKNLTWFSGKCFPGKFRRKTLSESCEKFKNVIICLLY